MLKVNDEYAPFVVPSMTEEPADVHIIHHNNGPCGAKYKYHLQVHGSS